MCACVKLVPVQCTQCHCMHLTVCVFVYVCLICRTYYVQLFYRKGPYSEEINLLSFPEGTCQVSTQCTLDEFEQ